MTGAPTDGGEARGPFAKAIGGVFLGVFVITGVGMGWMVTRTGAPWVFAVVPFGLAAVGLMAMIGLLKSGRGARSTAPGPGAGAAGAGRECEYCGRLAGAGETACGGCGGRVRERS